MAGGVGERFWPLSRRQRPKQLLPLAEGRSLLEMAHSHARALTGEDRVFILTTASLAPVIRERAPWVALDNIVVEPQGRNTAACLALAVATLEQRLGPCVMAVLTADHLIGDQAALLAALRRGCHLMQSHSQLLVFGIRPTRPETGYGYIEVGEVVDPDPALPCHRVRRFHEKPDMDTARRYMAAGTHLWNSGMFVWQTATLREAFARHAPVHAAAMEQMSRLDLAGGADRDALAAIFAGLPNLSIDHAVLEHADNVWVLPARFPWMDLGGWESVRQLLPLDGDANARQGPTIAVDTRGSTLYSTGPLVATCGVQDLIVVATDDAVLVCSRERAQEIRQVLAALRAEHQEAHL